VGVGVVVVVVLLLVLFLLVLFLLVLLLLRSLRFKLDQKAVKISVILVRTMLMLQRFILCSN
jgi:hypothetical protein